MTYGDFAWSDLLRKERRPARRDDRSRAVFVAGDPVPWMGPGENTWTWQISRALPHPLNRPFLTFVVPDGFRAHAALDDYVNPIMGEVKNAPLSLWAKLTRGQRTGLRIADTSPAFPPRIQRTLVIEAPAGYCDPAAVAEAVESTRLLPGHHEIGAHVTVRRLHRNDFDFGGNIRVIFDGLNKLLAGDMTRPQDHRITDLRIVGDRMHDDTIEVRLWQMD